MTDKLSKEDWIQKASEQYRKQGIIFTNDISLSDAIEKATQMYNSDPDAGLTDPVAYAKDDVTELFAGEDNEDKE